MSEKPPSEYLLEAEEGKFGPAMEALIPKHRAFVIALLSIPNCDHSRAAAEAGYAPGPSLRVAAHRIFHDDRVQAAMREEAKKRLDSSAVLAVNVLVGLAQNAKQDKDKIKAATAIMNRIGMHEKTEHHVTTKDESTTDEELIRRTKQLAQQMGIDPAKMLGSLGIVDAEFTEVSPQPDLIAIENSSQPDEENW